MSDLNQAEVVAVVLEEHPNADSLSVVRVWDAYTVCVRTEDWQGVNLGIYIPPDNIVPDTEQFAFLDNRRIKTRKFRGVMSQGLLVPIPEGFSLVHVGDVLSEAMGITRYVSAVDSNLSNRADKASPPPFPGPKYDIESWFKYRRAFTPGEDVVITEKLHGTNARFTYQDGEFHVASRSFYRKEDGMYWGILNENQWLKDFCFEHEGEVVYGEIFGWVQDLRYGSSAGEHTFKVFDVAAKGVLDDHYWKDYQNLEEWFTPDQRVPVLYQGSYSHEIVEHLISGKTTIHGAKHCREGVVIKPAFERTDDRFNRLILKAVSPEYLAKCP